MTSIKKHSCRTQSSTHRRAAMLVLIAICLPLCLIMAAFAVDVAWMQLARTELRTATDAAARAGTKELSLSQTESAARTRAKQVAARNLVAGAPLKLADADIQVGRGAQTGTGTKFKFTPATTLLNSMRVTGKRTSGSLSGPVGLMFAGVLGVKDFQPQEVATSTLLDRDICLVVDRSGSMMESLTGGPDPEGDCDAPNPTKSRWGALNTAVLAFLDELNKTPQDEHVGLVSYSSDITSCGIKYKISQIESDLVATNYTAVRNAMAKISSKPVKGNTAISAGIDDGVKVLTGKAARPYAVKTLILMTDGIHNLGREPLLAAQDAAKKGIIIDTITFSTDADIKRMTDVAAATGGIHIHANDLNQLLTAFKTIAATLPVLTTE
jgi:Ca-activated chloride channel homolog